MSLNGWLLFSNAAFFMLSGFALVASIGIFILTRANDRAKDRELRQYQATAGVNVARAVKDAETARAESARANERAALLEKEASEARERYTKLQSDNLKLQIELSAIQRKTDNIELGLAPRDLSKSQIDALAKSVRESGLAEIQVTILGDPEARAYGMKILSAMQASGIKIKVQHIATMIPTVHGIAATGTEAPVIARAFEKAGLRIAFIDEDLELTGVIVGLKEPN